MRPVALVVVAIIGTAGSQTAPEPGLHGQHLVVTIALLAVAAGIVGAIRIPDLRRPAVVASLVIAIGGAATLVGVQPDGPGFLGVFPAVSAAAMRLPARWNLPIAGLAGASVAVAWGINGHRSLTGIVLNELGVGVFYLFAVFARRLRESNEQARVLIGELEQSRAVEAEAAVLAERQRLAREMHDVLAHSLSGLMLNLESARLLADRPDTDPALVEAVGRAHRLAKTGLEEARRAIGMLRDDELPGPDRLPSLTAEFETDSGVACTLAVTGTERPLVSDGRLTLYRVAQEALTNIRKHARAERVELWLAYEPEGARLTIEDFGPDGRTTAPRSDKGYGLTGMRERAELLGGRLTAGPTPKGFRVEVWVPG